jgi:hypothetical protein
MHSAGRQERAEPAPPSGVFASSVSAGSCRSLHHRECLPILAAPVSVLWYRDVQHAGPVTPVSMSWSPVLFHEGFLKDMEMDIPELYII